MIKNKYYVPGDELHDTPYAANCWRPETCSPQETLHSACVEAGPCPEDGSSPFYNCWECVVVMVGLEWEQITQAKTKSTNES